MICSAVSDSFVICAWFLQRSWLSVSICLLFQSIWPFFSPFASNIHVVWWVLVLLLGWVSECFRWVVRNVTCRDILQSSVIWGCPSPMFLFHILVLVSSQQVFLQARQLSLPGPLEQLRACFQSKWLSWLQTEFWEQPVSDLCVGFHPLMTEQPLLEVRLIHEESGRVTLELH